MKTFVLAAAMAALASPVFAGQPTTTNSPGGATMTTQTVVMTAIIISAPRTSSISTGISNAISGGFAGMLASAY